MKMNKKLLATFMSLVIMGTTFVGCGSNENTSTTQNTVVEEAVSQNTTENMDSELTEEIIDESTEEIMEEEAYGEVDPTVAQELFFVLTDGIELPASMSLDAQTLADTYGIDTNLLDSYYVSLPMMNVHATEIAIFELKDEADMETIKEGIHKRQQDLVAQWESYLPEQLELVQNFKLITKDNQVAFIISEHAEEMAERFLEA